MDDEQDFEFDLGRRLTDELRCRLDPQVGRAAPYFLERYAARDVRPRKHRRRRGAVVGAFAAAMAACCAAVALWRAGRDDDRPVGIGRQQDVATAIGKAASRVDEIGASNSQGSGNDGRAVPALSPDVSVARTAHAGGTASPPPLLVIGRSARGRTFDEGTLLVGRTPMRKVRRQWLERVEWFDTQHGARLQRIVPREEIVFVPLSIN